MRVRRHSVPDAIAGVGRLGGGMNGNNGVVVFDTVQKCGGCSGVIEWLSISITRDVGGTFFKVTRKSLSDRRLQSVMTIVL